MKLLFDQNISPRILKQLPSDFSASSQVRFEKLENASDLDILMFARNNDFSVVTFDADFVDLNTIHGSPPKIIYLNTGNLTTRSILKLISENISSIKQFVESNDEGVLEILW